MTEWKRETVVQTEPTRFSSKTLLVDYINYCIKYNVTKNKKCVLVTKRQSKYFTLITGGGNAIYPADLNLKGITEGGSIVCE